MPASCGDKGLEKSIGQGSAIKPQMSLRTVYAECYKLFLQSSELGLPHPDFVPPPFGSWGGTHSLAVAGEGVGGSQFGRGERHCGTLGIYVPVCTLWSWRFSLQRKITVYPRVSARFLLCLLHSNDESCGMFSRENSTLGTGCRYLSPYW